jgi:threonyl-tRNA synthetase
MAHVLAQAVKRLWGSKVQVTIGPVTEDGFYYDFKVQEPFVPEDLPKIEAEMQKIIAQNFPLVRKEVSRSQAMAFFRELGEEFKIRIIQDIPETEPLTTYTQGDFTDLCRGPHMPSTGYGNPAFKLTNISAAYWRGDSRVGESLCRVYGTAFFSQKDLDEYLKQIEEAKKRDHRVLGPALDLFSFHPESPGQPLWHPKGVMFRNLLFTLLRHELNHMGYIEIETPQILSDQLWKRSGHYEKFRDHMFFCDLPQEQHVKYGIKPMNCPGAALFYKSRRRSYRELPLRVSEFGKVYRYEPGGVLHGLLRVRGFTQDDAHVFCRLEDVSREVLQLIAFIKRIYKAFDFSGPRFVLSTRPQNHMGRPETWDQAEQALRTVLDTAQVEYTVEEGAGAFYGPKIDFAVKDALGRIWQCGTIQLDFLLPERFELTAISESGEAEPVVMIHRALLGSLERFMGIVIENYGGKFPAWLAPTQVKVLPITDGQVEYINQVVIPILRKNGIRYEVDLRNEKINYKIRENQVYRVPYLLIVGKQEVESDTVSVRNMTGEQIHGIKLQEFLGQVQWSIVDHVAGG